MPTLSEYAKLENDMMKSGVMEHILTADALMPFLQFKSIEGNAFLYNRESTLPTTAFHAVGDTWANTEATYAQKTATLQIVGTQSNLDRYAMQTRSSQNSQESVVLAGMAKSLARKIAQKVISGDSGTTSTEFEGLTSLCITDTRHIMMDNGSSPTTVAGSETELTLDRLDEMIDSVMDGQQKPDVLIMNTTMRRKLSSLSRATGSGVLMNSLDEFGRMVSRYDGIPIVLTNWITNAEQYENADGWGSSTATSIFAVIFGEENQGFTVLHNGPVLNPDIQFLGTSKTANEEEYRMVLYLQTALFSVERIAALFGIDSAA